MAVKKAPPRRDKGRPRGASITEAVLTSTLEDLARAGLAGVSIERIAQGADVNKTSVYRRWPTREALIAAALEGVLEDVSGRLEDTGSLRSDLLALLGRIAALLDQPAGLAVLRAALSQGADSPAAELAARRLAAPAQGPLRALVARAKARGEWRRGARIDLLLSSLIGALIHRALLEHQELTKRWLSSLVDHALLGALPRAAEPRGAKKRRA
jgi:AcrR family transcriptional regulator